MIESASRWLVGSSSRSVVALCAPPSEAANRMRASSTRRRWPPESVAIGWSSTRSGSPRWAQMRAASLSAAYPPSAENRSSMRPYARTALSFCSPSTSSAIGRLGLLHLAQHLVEAAGREHPVLRGDPQVALAGVLRQVADGAVGADLAAVGLALARQHTHRGGLAGAVAPDEADAVARLHAQGGAGQQDPGPGAQFQVGGGDHEGAPEGCWRVDVRWPRRPLPDPDHRSSVPGRTSRSGK